MANIDNLDIQITASADGAVRGLKRISSACDDLRGAAKGASAGASDLSGAVSDMGNASKAAGESAEKAGEAAKKSGKDMHEAGNNAKKGTSGITNFWNALKRVAFYRVVRSILKEIAAGFKEGITNLYQWSSAVNGHFAASMNRLATSSQYLKNSLGAMVSPLIEMWVPIIDTVVDKIVVALNYVNQFFAALSGKTTYTAAKKVAAVWDDSSSKMKKTAKSVADDIKRTILGFDEINKLVKPDSSSGGSGSSSGSKTPNYGSMFEERPIEGVLGKLANITKDWPDWLKALLGIGVPIAAGMLLKNLPNLLKKLFDRLSDLAHLKIPNWLNRILGGEKGSGGGDGGPLIPDEIKMPETTLPVNLVKKDWSLLDNIERTPVDIPVWLYRANFKDIEDWLKIPTIDIPIWLYRGNFKNIEDWLDIPTVDVPIWLYRGNFKTLQDWITQGKGYVDVPVWLYKANFKDLESWVTDGKKHIDVPVWLYRGNFKTLEDWIGSPTIDVPIWLYRGNFKSLEDWLGSATVDVPIWLYKGNFKKLQDWITQGKGYVDVPIWLYKGNYTKLQDWITKGQNNLDVPVWLYRGNFKNVEDWLSKDGKNKVNAAVTLVPPVTALFNNFKAQWDATKQDLLVGVKLFKSGWNTVSELLDESFGTSGGGGFTRGGGAGRQKGNVYSVNVGVNDPTQNDVKGYWNVLETLWNGYTWLYRKELKVAVDAYGEWTKFKMSILDYLGLGRLNTSAVVDVVRGWYGNVKDWLGLSNLYTDVTVGVKAKKGSGVELVSSGGAGGKAWVLQAKALGGILADGLWSNIPQFAGGATGIHGTLFAAGENGAEIVGNVGSRTEVLNRSQLASAMYSSVSTAIAPAVQAIASAGNAISRSTENTGNSETTALLEECVSLLRMISEKEISTSGIAKAMTRTNRRVGTAVVPTGG